MSSFDPDLTTPTGVTLMHGECTSIAVTEPPSFGGLSQNNFVIDPSRPFRVSVEWEVDGLLANLWLSGLASTGSPNWNVMLYVESQGPGDEILAGSANVPVLPLPAGPAYEYSADITVPPGTLQENIPGVSSGIYQVTVCIFLDSTLGAPGYDVTGFHTGPVIKAENPN